MQETGLAFHFCGVWKVSCLTWQANSGTGPGLDMELGRDLYPDLRPLATLLWTGMQLVMA